LVAGDAFRISLPSAFDPLDEIQFLSGSRRVGYPVGGYLEVKNGTPAGEPLFTTRLPTLGAFDVSKDERFLIDTVIEQSPSVPIAVVVNRNAGLKR